VHGKQPACTAISLFYSGYQQSVGYRIETQSTVLHRDCSAEVSALAHLSHQVFRKGATLIVFSCPWSQNAASELSRTVYDFTLPIVKLDFHDDLLPSLGYFFVFEETDNLIDGMKVLDIQIFITDLDVEFLLEEGEQLDCE
jgi:hypothetical protein